MSSSPALFDMNKATPIPQPSTGAGNALFDMSKATPIHSTTQGLTDAERTQLHQLYDARPWWRKALGLSSEDPEAQRLEQKDLAAHKPAMMDQMQDFYTHDPGGIYAMNTVSNLAQGGQEVGQGEFTKGAHHIIKGATIGASPLLVPALASAPLATGLALAGGTAGSAAGSVGAQALGSDEDTQQLAADIGGILGGYGAGRVGAKITGAGFKNIVNALDKLAPKGSLQADLVKLIGGYRFTKGLDIARKVADLVPDHIAAETHPATSKVLNDVLDQTLGPTAKLHDVAPPGSYAAAQRPGTVAGAPNAPVGVLKAQGAATAEPATTTPAAPLKFTRPPGDAPQVQMKVDPAKMDAAIPRDDFYVGKGGQGAVPRSSAMPGRYTRFQQWLKDNPDTPIEAPRVHIYGEGNNVGFTNGRHRFAVLRDMGVPEVQISVEPDQVGIFEKTLGATQVKPPHPEDAQIAKTLSDVIDRMKAEPPKDMSPYYGENAGKSNNFGKTGKPTAKFKRDFPQGVVPASPKPSWSMAVDRRFLSGNLGDMVR